MQQGPELVEMPPMRLDDLSELNEQGASCYRPAEGGGFELKPACIEAINQLNEEITKTWQETQEGLAEKDREIERLKKLFSTTVKTDAIVSALVAAGVDRKKIKWGLTFLLEHLPITLEERDGDLVPVVEGFASVAAAVQTFLASETGSFLAPKQPTAPGPVTLAVRRLMH
jgi:hypothetical protein